MASGFGTVAFSIAGSEVAVPVAVSAFVCVSAYVAVVVGVILWTAVLAASNIIAEEYCDDLDVTGMCVKSRSWSDRLNGCCGM